LTVYILGSKLRRRCTTNWSSRVWVWQWRACRDGCDICEARTAMTEVALCGWLACPPSGLSVCVGVFIERQWTVAAAESGWDGSAPCVV